MDYDERAQWRQKKEYVAWKERLRESTAKISGWVSSFRGGEQCTMLPDFNAGSYNLVLMFRFDLDGARWVARFAIPGQVMDPDAKMIREVATMRFLHEHTSIPVPAVHAYGTSEENELGLGAFIIMDYVEGVRLGNLWTHAVGDDEFKLNDDIDEQDFRQVYRQVVGFLLELQNKPFDKVGSLASMPDGSIAASVSPLTMRMQEIEYGGGPRLGAGREETFSSTDEYFRYVSTQTAAQLFGQANSINDAVDARVKYINQRRLEAIVPAFVNSLHNDAPARLICDDMRMGNIMVRSAADLEIVAIIDWEWSYAGPYQLFYSAPRWLVDEKPYRFNDELMARYNQLLNLFLEEMRKVEDERAAVEDTPSACDHLCADELPNVSESRAVNANSNHEIHNVVIPKRDDPASTTTASLELTLFDPDVSFQSHETTEWLPVRIEQLPPHGDLLVSEIAISTKLRSAGDDPNSARPAGPERLSDLIRQTVEDGRIWIHELLLRDYIGADNLPWRKLVAQYPQIREIVVDEAEVRAFVTRKINDLKAYDIDWALIQVERAETRRIWDEEYEARLKRYKEEKAREAQAGEEGAEEESVGEEGAGEEGAGEKATSDGQNRGDNNREEQDGV